MHSWEKPADIPRNPIFRYSGCAEYVFCNRPVGSSRRVEWPSVVMSEAAQRVRVSCEAWKNFATYFYGGKEAALAASATLKVMH